MGSLEFLDAHFWRENEIDIARVTMKFESDFSCDFGCVVFGEYVIYSAYFMRSSTF